jgi:enoyl-CoA hydratase/carnithine racemase
MLKDLKQVLFDVDGPRATLTFNRPDQLNALSPTLIAEALAVSKHVAGRPDIRVMIVRGNGRAFSAGVDLKALQSPEFAGETAASFGPNARELALTWETMPQPVIARVAGYCFTGGLEIALGCDFIVCSDDSQFCDTHAKLGFVPAWGLAARLARRIPLQNAKEMSYTARRVGAAEAKALGLVLDSVPIDQLDARVDALADSIVQLSGGSVAAYKDLYRRAQNSFLDQGVAHEGSKMYVIADRKERQAATTASLGGGKG